MVTFREFLFLSGLGFKMEAFRFFYYYSIQVLTLLGDAVVVFFRGSLRQLRSRDIGGMVRTAGGLEPRERPRPQT